jgi:hypothetical protein
MFQHLSSGFSSGLVFARIVSNPGQIAQLVSSSGSVLDPAQWQLVCQVAGPGAWLALVPVVSQPSLFQEEKS